MTACLAVVLLAACHDTVTPPTSTSLAAIAPVARSAWFSDAANFGANNSPASGSYDAVIDPWDAGSPRQLIATFPYATIVTVSSTGSVSQVPGALNGDGLVYGPDISLEGNINGQGAMTFDSGSKTVTIRGGNLYALRNPLGDPQPHGGLGWSCGAQLGRAFPCWTFAGAAHLEFTRIRVAMTLTSSIASASPIMASKGAMRSVTAVAPHSSISAVTSGTSVTFTAGKERDTIDRIPVYMTGVSWHWVPDQPSADTAACGTTILPVCGRAMLHSGTMYATAYVNGEQQEQQLHVDVTTSISKLTVTCAPSTPLRGDIVQCVGTVSPTQPFTITERHARGAGYASDVLDPEVSANGDSVIWRGKAIIPTTVTMVARLNSPGADQLTSEPASFGIKLRDDTAWKRLLMPDSSTIYTDKDPLPFDPFPNVTAGQQMDSPDGALGKTTLGQVHPWLYVSEGPNAKMYYASAAMKIDKDSTKMYIHSWLQSDNDFYKKQRGQNNPVMGLRDCRGSDIDALRRRVVAHESLHYDVYDKFFKANDVQKKWEEIMAPFDVATMTSADGPKEAWKLALRGAYVRTMDSLQAKVDQDNKVMLPSCRINK
ncbi:MAG: hypothetical protein ABJE10_18255 [bacterium]